MMKTPSILYLPRLLLCLPLFILGCAGELGCGDGLLQSGEQCDDANNSDNDGCSALCQIETGSDCGPPPNIAPNAKLQSCDLTGAALGGADLEGADLNGASLIGAELSDAILRGANLERSGLLLARLIRADLSGAFLGEANLTDADLSSADLTGASLDDANLFSVDLTDADLTGATGKPLNASTAIYNNTICPSGLNSNATEFTCIDQGF